MNPIQEASLMLKLQDSIQVLRQKTAYHAERLMELNEENVRLKSENARMTGELEDWAKWCSSEPGEPCHCVPHKILKGANKSDVEPPRSAS